MSCRVTCFVPLFTNCVNNSQPQIRASKVLWVGGRLMSSVTASMDSLPTSNVTLFDGGTGEELFRRGVENDRNIWSAVAVVKPKYHDALVSVHRAYIDAGCDIFTANNFGITPGVGFSLPEMLEFSAVAAQLAVRARDESGRDTVRIAASLPPLVESYRPDLVMKDEEEGESIYRQLCNCVRPYVDVLLAETISSIAEMRMAIRAAMTADMPFYASWTLGSDGRLRSGEDVDEAIEFLLDLTSGTSKLEGVLFNCCEPEAVTKALEVLDRVGSRFEAKLQDRNIAIGACPNRLTPVDPNWTIAENPEPQPFREDLDSETFSDQFVRRWRELVKGRMILGGCCGLGPEYIAALHQFRQQQH